MTANFRVDVIAGQLTIWGGSQASGMPVTRPASKPYARRTDPATSMGAAVYAMPVMGATRAKALAALQAAGSDGLTDFQLEAITGVKQTSVGKRRCDLMRDGLVEALVRDGKPVRRFAPSGALAQVWVCTEFTTQSSDSCGLRDVDGSGPAPSPTARGPH